MSDQQKAAAVRDDVVASAANVPQLVEAAKVADPDLFAALKGMPASRLYAPPATAIIAWLAGRYGLDLPPDVCSAIALFLVAAGAGIVHAIRPTPVAKLPGAKVLLLGALLAGGSLSACATTTAATAIGTALVAGQLFCAIQPGIVRVVNMSGEPVSVIGRTAIDVELFCAAIGGVPVSPPADPAAAPVTVTPAIY